MLQKFVTILIVLSLLPVFLFAQERAILKPNGEYYWIKGESKGLDNEYGGFPKGYKSKINVNKFSINR